MTPLDPQAATAAYLAGLSPALREASAAYTDNVHWAWVIGGVVTVVVAWIILRSGLLTRLQARIERDKPRPWLAASACIAVYVMASSLLSAPWALYAAWRADQLVHAAARSPGDYVAAALNRDVYSLTLAVIGGTLLYGIMRWSPRRWWIWGSAIALALSLAVVWVPYALASGPAPLPAAPQGPIRDGLLRLIRDSALPAREIYVSASPGIDADVTGAPGRPRVVITRGLLARTPVAEARAGVGHLIGHYVNGDQLSLAMLTAVLGAAGLSVAGLLFAPMARLLGAQDLVHPSEPGGMPVLVVIAVGWLAIATPAMNGFIRLINVRADQYSLDHAREPDGLAASLVRANGYDKADPSSIEEAVFYDHPSLRSRVLHAMTWKAAHPS